jgi:hypothetical protein
MLSLYLAVPPSANLTARAGELIAAAETACGRPLAARDRDWVLEKLLPCLRDCTGRTVAVFACAGSGPVRGHPAAVSAAVSAAGARGARRPAAHPALAAGPPALFGARPGFARRHLVVRSTGPPHGCHDPGYASRWSARHRPARLPGRGQRRLVQTLVVPADGLVPGTNAAGAARWVSAPTAALPVPDVIEEMVSRVLEDGGDVLVAGGGWSPPPRSPPGVD